MGFDVELADRGNGFGLGIAESFGGYVEDGSEIGGGEIFAQFAQHVDEDVDGGGGQSGLGGHGALTRHGVIGAEDEPRAVDDVEPHRGPVLRRRAGNLAQGFVEIKAVVRRSDLVGRERHRHMRRPVQRKRMVGTLDAKNSLIRAQVDLHHHMHLRQLFHQPLRVVLIHHVHPVPNALRMSPLHRLADMEPKPLRRHQPRSQLSGMKGDGNSRERGVQEVQHLHL